MAEITPGTAGTLASTTAEGALQEILSFIRIQEGTTGRNPQELTSVNLRHDADASACIGTISFSAARTIAADGSISIVATPYLQSHDYAPGTNGTFKSGTPEGAAIEILEYLQILEADSNANPNGENRITSSFDSDRGLYTGSFNVPVALALGASGEAIYTAQTYLN